MLKNKETLKTVFLSLGSNIGDSKLNISNAYHFIESQIGKMVSVSAFYKTQPWGNKNQTYFLNSVCEVSTFLSPIECLNTIHEIEKKLGRSRNSKWEARIIDIDILFYENQIINDIWLTIPHPYISERKFVLQPLTEIAPNFVHPVYNKNIETLLSQTPDKSEVVLQKNDESETEIKISNNDISVEYFEDF